MTQQQLTLRPATITATLLDTPADAQAALAADTISQQPDGTWVAQKTTSDGIILTWTFSLGDWLTADGSIVPAAQMAQIAVIGTNQTTVATLQAAARAALAANTTFLGIATPTTAQAVAQVRALTRQMDALIHLALNDYTTDVT